jgi:hypothetical protein
MMDWDGDLKIKTPGLCPGVFFEPIKRLKGFRIRRFRISPPADHLKHHS